MPPWRVYSKVHPVGSRPQEVEVSASVLYMSMSLDGYIAGPNDEPANPGGDGFDRLHEWYFTPDGEFVRRRSGPAGEFWDEMDATVRCWRVGGPWSRSITGAVMLTVSRSSCLATGRRVLRWRTIRW
jgi:hypothetical protein